MGGRGAIPCPLWGHAAAETLCPAAGLPQPPWPAGLPAVSWGHMVPLEDIHAGANWEQLGFTGGNWDHTGNNSDCTGCNWGPIWINWGQLEIN